jgi:hypothetical protein
MLNAHKKVRPFLRISASIQFMSFDVRVSYNGTCQMTGKKLSEDYM